MPCGPKMRSRRECALRARLTVQEHAVRLPERGGPSRSTQRRRHGRVTLRGAPALKRRALCTLRERRMRAPPPTRDRSAAGRSALAMRSRNTARGGRAQGPSNSNPRATHPATPAVTYFGGGERERPGASGTSSERRMRTSPPTRSPGATGMPGLPPRPQNSEFDRA